ncbi:Helix-turn-helix [Amphibacillus marinus]|uniref:Helix-turn-helix n=1 Tax=Amphibacillus marinus TaxID=872970 RepID=A0A1H8SQX3_9BACI|nr:helix-turn-helix transcriptional regulator [Amphibacillus marinus]SEO80906.1 Helix-turn-helix [Amphibacillus marinus]
MKFHERLRKCREEIGLKQNSVAEKIGVKNNTLSSYEKGIRQPDYETLNKLAKLYNVSIDYLINGSQESEQHENLFFFDMEGLSEKEIDDIKEHIRYVKWKSEQGKEE